MPPAVVTSPPRTTLPNPNVGLGGLSGAAPLMLMVGPLLAILIMAPILAWAIHWLTPAAVAFGGFYCQLFPAGAC